MPNQGNLYLGRKGIGIGCLLFSLFLVTLVVFYTWSGTTKGYPHSCVELPNGLLIATAPNPRPHSFRGRRIHILKKPDGTIIVPHPSQKLTITKTTVYGVAGPTVRNGILYKFAYRSDIGLVLESENLDSYTQIIREAGQRVRLEKKRKFTSSWLVYSEGKRSQRNWRTDCPVNTYPKSDSSIGIETHLFGR